MDLHEPENPEYPYSFFSWHSKDKGKTVWSIKGPGVPLEPHLSGSYNQFDSHLQVQILIGWLNTAFHTGQVHVQSNIKTALGL